MCARYILVCAFLLLSACADRASEGGSEPAYIEVAEAPTLVDDADLVQIRDLRIDAENRIWVLSRHAPLVRVYGSDGGRIAAFGELGQGPEEFRAPSHLIEIGGSGMGVLDAGHSNIRAFAADGTLLEAQEVAMEFRLPLAMRDIYFGDLGWTWAVEGGFLQDRYPPPPAGGPMQLQQAYDFWAGELVLLPEDGGEPRTVLTLADYSTFSPDEPPAPRPLSAGPLWDLCPGDEFVLHTGATSELVRVGMDGSVRRRDPVQLPLGPVDGDILLDWMVAALSTQPPMPGDTPEALRGRASAVAEMAEPNLEPTVPPTRLRCDPRGRVWIQLFDMDHDRRGYAREWTVVGAEGELLAHVTFPEGFHPIRFGTDRVVGIVRDEFDAETVGWVPLPAVS